MAPTDSTKKVLEDFIKIHRTHLCLCQIKSKEYHDQDKKKEAAYKLLVSRVHTIQRSFPKAHVTTCSASFVAA